MRQQKGKDNYRMAAPGICFTRKPGACICRPLRIDYLLVGKCHKICAIVLILGRCIRIIGLCQKFDKLIEDMYNAITSKKEGVTPILILKKRGVTERKGNQLLEYLMDTDVRFMDTDSYDDIYAEMDRVGQASGKKYYKIPCGGSNAIGALGYVNCMKEIADTSMHFDYICCAEGSGGTHAGVALGAKLFMPKTQVVGLMVDSDPFEIITTRIMQETAKLLKLDFVPTESDVHLVNMCGPGYAIPSPEGNAAIRMMAANEGLFLDPVYTGKAFAGLIKLAREGKFKSDDNVLYLYSGGAGGLFAIDVDLG